MMILFTFICVMAVSVVLFGFWIVTTAFKTIWRLINGVGQSRTTTVTGRQCMNAGCRTANPQHACFCRRCGSSLSDIATHRQPAMQQPRYNAQSGRGRQVASI